MGKKQRGQQPAKGQPKTTKELVPDEPISAMGRRIIAIGAACVVVGFIVLSRADPMGQNWAANLSPFLILGGYALLAVGIFYPEQKGGDENISSQPPIQP